MLNLSKTLLDQRAFMMQLKMVRFNIGYIKIKLFNYFKILGHFKCLKALFDAGLDIFEPDYVRFNIIYFTELALKRGYIYKEF